MRRYRANEIVQAASMLVVMAQSANAGEGACLTLASSGLPTTIGGASIEMKAENEVDGAPPSVYINITDEDSDALCTAVQSMVSEDGYGIECGLGANVTCAGN